MKRLTFLGTLVLVLAVITGCTMFGVNPPLPPQPTCTLLAYSSIVKGIGNIYITTQDGSVVMQVTSNSDPGVTYGQVRWSPDGEKIAFNQASGVAPNRTSKLFYYSLETKQVTLVYERHETSQNPHTGGLSWPEWLDNDTLIVGTRDTTSDSLYLARVNINGSGFGTFLYESDAEIRCADVSNSGAKVAFIKQPNYWGYNSEVCTANTDGSGFTQLTHTSDGSDNIGNNRYVCFTTDDSRLLFVRGNHKGLFRIWSMNVDGSDQINISGNLQKRMSVYTVSPFLLGGQTYVVFTARILTDAEYAAGNGNIHSSQPFDVFIGELEGNQLVNVTNLTATNEASETFVDVKQ